VILLENNESFSEGKSVAEVFNHYFANITNSLGIEGTRENTASTNCINDPVENIYSLHSSIKKIRERFHPT